jgi:hypothetical protein
MAKQIGSALIELGLEPAKESFVGIYAKNRPEVSENFFFLSIMKQ